MGRKWRSHTRRVPAGTLIPPTQCRAEALSGYSLGRGSEGREAKRKGLLLPPADAGAVHPRGAGAVTIGDGRGGR